MYIVALKLQKIYMFVYLCSLQQRINVLYFTLLLYIYCIDLCDNQYDYLVMINDNMTDLMTYTYIQSTKTSYSL